MQNTINLQSYKNRCVYKICSQPFTVAKDFMNMKKEQLLGEEIGLYLNAQTLLSAAHPWLFNVYS